MKQIFVKHYDKFLAIGALSLLALFFGLQITDQIGLNDVDSVADNSYGWSRSSDGVILQSTLKNDLMPGNHIFYKVDDNYSRIEISKLIFKRRSDVTIQLVSGKVLKGTIKPKEGVVISKNWKSINTPLLLDIDGRVTPIQLRTIKNITGTPKYVLSDNADLTVLRDKQPHFYQRGQFLPFISKNRKRPVWNEIKSESNNTIFELFTPPLIYIIDDELTTTLPETPIEEEEKEPFGVSIVSFSEKPYRFRLASWIGSSPFIEDIFLSEKFGRTVRIRLEVNSSYKLVENPKPGRPSLLEVESNSTEKLLTLKYFTVQNVTQKNGGVKPVGRALIEDHFLKIKPFEINSLMENVFLGQFELKLRFKIGKEDSYEEILSAGDIDKEITYNGRNYKVLEFDSDRKSVKLRKASTIPNQFEDLELLAP
jgi:hypothetical protein